MGVGLTLTLTANPYPNQVNFFAFPNARLPLCLQRLETGQRTGM